jgi:hypothetical protein
MAELSGADRMESEHLFAYQFRHPAIKAGRD